MRRETKAATGGTVAAGIGAPGGADFQPHCTPSDDLRQDPQLIRLHRLANAAKARGDYAGFCELRRAELNRQAELYSRQEGNGK